MGASGKGGGGAGAPAPAGENASALSSLSPAHTASETAFQEFLETVPAPTEQTVAEILAMILKSPAGDAKSWNVTVLVDGIALKNPALDWHHVAALLDLGSFHVRDEGALEMLMRIWRQAISDTFPLS